jgi:hypothetical protein
MASATILSPRPVEIAPAASLEVSQLDQLCSGNLDSFLEEATGMFLSKHSQASKKAAANGSKPAKANAAEKQVREFVMLSIKPA